jgi:hypothetical protein
LSIHDCRLEIGNGLSPGALLIVRRIESSIENRQSQTFHYIGNLGCSPRWFYHGKEAGLCAVFRLDYISCLLTVLSTVLIGKRYWHGWVLAGLNSVIICVIARNTAQLGFIPANVFCLGLYAYNVRAWRKADPVKN